LAIDPKNTYGLTNKLTVKSKLRITQAMKLFSEGKSPVDVVVGLDHAADRVRAIYRKYWELKLVLTWQDL
jgi:hypothetical protein